MPARCIWDQVAEHQHRQRYNGFTIANCNLLVPFQGAKSAFCRQHIDRGNRAFQNALCRDQRAHCADVGCTAHTKTSLQTNAMKPTVIPPPLLVALALGAGAVYQLASAADPAKPPAEPAANLKRGEYLVAIGGCHDCHTPFKMGERGPEPDMKRALSGHPAEMKLPPAPVPSGLWIWAGAATNTAFAGPWGVSYSANLTADKVTGLGNWKARDFVAAMRTGKHLGVGRPIMPPMPWQGYAKMTDSDLNAVFAHLLSVPAMANRVPDYQPPVGK